LIEDRVDISESVSERVQKVLSHDKVQSPRTDTSTQAQAILPHEFHWNIDIYVFALKITVKYNTLTWLYKLFSTIRPWIWGLKPLINVTFQYSNFYAAKIFMRCIVQFGDYLLGRRSEDPWITPKALILFWLIDYLVLKRLGISKLDWVLGLWSCNAEIHRWSLWFVSGKDFLIILALRAIGGLLLGLSRAAGEDGISNSLSIYFAALNLIEFY
jgi:hypothetical protein